MRKDEEEFLQRAEDAESAEEFRVWKDKER
jgi:hypothetical protein